MEVSSLLLSLSFSLILSLSVLVLNFSDLLYFPKSKAFISLVFSSLLLFLLLLLLFFELLELLDISSSKSCPLFFLSSALLNVLFLSDSSLK